MMKIYTTPSQIDISKVILWQYENAARLRQVVQMIQDMTNMSSCDLWNLISDLFNLNLPIDETNETQYKIRMIGLSELSLLFGIDKPYSIINGEKVDVSPNVWRRYIKGMIFLMDSDGTATDIIDWLRITFPENTNLSVKDGLNMTMAYVITNNLTDDDKMLIGIPGFLPHPAGVKVVSEDMLKIRAFGFETEDQSDDNGIRGNFNTSMFLGENYPTTTTENS